MADNQPADVRQLTDRRSTVNRQMSDSKPITRRPIVFLRDLIFTFRPIFPLIFVLFTLRNVGMGTSTSAARVGSFLSSYIVYSQRVHKLLPFGIMGLNALIAGLLCMTLPETRDQPTLEVMETTDEGQNMELLAQDDEKKKRADDSHL